MDSSVVGHILEDVTLGVAKADSKWVRTPEEEALWDQLAEEVAAMTAKGVKVDMVTEFPST